MKFKLVVILTSALCLMACNNQKKENSNNLSKMLYLKSISLTNAYIDSIMTANDSSSLYRLYRTFESRLSALNDEYPVAADLNLSESQNDTLSYLYLKIIDMRNRKLKKLLNKNKAPKDSLDSIGNYKIESKTIKH